MNRIYKKEYSNQLNEQFSFDEKEMLVQDLVGAHRLETKNHIRSLIKRGDYAGVLSRYDIVTFNTGYLIWCEQNNKKG